MTGAESAVQIHIDRGDDLNARDDKGQTPLMLSAARNKAAICTLLLKAGADASLLDPSGRNALGIALAAGALDAASVIKAGHRHRCTEQTFAQSAQVTNRAAVFNNGNLKSDRLIDQSSSLHVKACAPEMLSVVISGSTNFDLSGWEAEEDQAPPENDSMLAAAAAETQTAITGHHTVDTSVDWNDIEASLPDRATSLQRAADIEARERLRLVLLRAIREGSVPQAAIEDLTRGDDGEPDTEAGRLLGMVINDLGAETDERFEYSAPHESFTVFVAPGENPGEEDAVADALAFVDDLAAQRNEPLHVYKRALQREALLTAEAEVALGQAMERGIEKALDALAAWPTGIRTTLEAARLVAKGTRPLRAMSSYPQVEPLEVGAEGGTNAQMDTGADLNADLESTAADGEPAAGEDEEDSQLSRDVRAFTDELAEFSTTAELLSSIPVGTITGISLRRDIRCFSRPQIWVHPLARWIAKN